MARAKIGRAEPTARRPVDAFIESRDGIWIARDVLGTSRIEIDVADPARAEAEAHDWVRSICDPRPRELYLIDFPDTTRADLERALEHACPSLSVRPALVGCVHPHL